MGRLRVLCHCWSDFKCNVVGSVRGTTFSAFDVFLEAFSIPRPCLSTLHLETPEYLKVWASIKMGS